MICARTLKSARFKIKICETCHCHRNGLYRLKYRYHSRNKGEPNATYFKSEFYSEFESISFAWQYMLSKQSSCDNAGIGQCKKQNQYHFLWLSEITTESFKHRGSKNLATKN